jgi:hypothetical protein
MRNTLLLAASAILAGAFFVSDAHAIRRVNTLNKSCATVQDIVYHDGAVILRHQSKRVPGLPLYDRYVADITFCPLDQVTKWSSVPTADDPTCAVKRCERRDPIFKKRRLWLFDD